MNRNGAERRAPDIPHKLTGESATANTPQRVSLSLAACTVHTPTRQRVETAPLGEFAIVRGKWHANRNNPSARGVTCVVRVIPHIDTAAANPGINGLARALCPAA